MIDHLVRTLMGFITSHSDWALPIIFIVTFGESFVFIAFVCPGTTVLLAAGALVAGGALPFWPVLIGGLAGAILGDAISYALGRRYGHLTETVWPFTKHPEMLKRGYAFFGKHGSKSLYIGRFFGPFRAVLPLLAGITKMPVSRFWFANIGSACIWVPALLIPGAVAGYVLAELGEHGKWKLALAAALTVALGTGLWLARRLGYFQKLKLDL